MSQFLEDMANGVSNAAGYSNLYMGRSSVKPGNLPSREMDSWTEAAMCYTLRQRLHSEFIFPLSILEASHWISITLS